MKEFFLPEISTRPLVVLEEHQGGMGRVYVVESHDGNKFALKTLKWELGFDKYVLAEEAAKLVELPNHPNIIQVSGLFWHEGAPYICMPYCKGSLRNRMSAEKAIDTPSATEILMQVSRGLSCIHDRTGMLHLDLKPQNILISQDGTYIISDFGIAQSLPRPTQEGIHADLFVSGITGTIAYMSPEHFVSGQLSAKSDIFALGVILFEMLTGRHPFLANTLKQTIQNVLSKDPEFTLSERISLPSLIHQICVRCLEKNPTRRPSADEICNALDLISSGSIRDSSTAHADIANMHDKATVLMQLGRSTEAQQLLETCLAENPWYLPAIVNLAELHFHQGRVDVAAKLADDALALSDWSSNTKSLGSLLSNLASYYLSINPEQSIQYARGASKLDPYDWQALGNLAEACRVLGEARKRSDLIDEGLSLTHKALVLNPKDIKLRVNYCGLLFAAGDFETLSPYIVQLLTEIGGDNVSLRVTLIKTLIATGQLDDALRWLNPMRDNQPLQSIVSQLDRDILQRQSH